MNRKLICAAVSLYFITLVIALPRSLAVDYDLKELTPKVKTALDNRKTRHTRISELKVQQVIGENNKGYIELLDGDAVLNEIVKNENADRKIIYETIAEQNGIKDKIATIEKVFASVKRDNARPGEKIQLENGEWVTKQ